MHRCFVPLVVMAVVLAAFVSPGARAAKPLDLGTEPGTMVSQAVSTLGGTFVDCSGLVSSSVPATAQVACARIPEDMFGYFKMGVHGRLYEYLVRGTLRVASNWKSVGNVLEAVYRLQGGTLTVERERVNGNLYGIFAFEGTGAYAATSSSGN